MSMPLRKRRKVRTSGEKHIRKPFPRSQPFSSIERSKLSPRHTLARFLWHRRGLLCILNKQLVRKDILIPLRLSPVGSSLFYTLVCSINLSLTLACYIRLGKILVPLLVPAPSPWPRSQYQVEENDHSVQSHADRVWPAFKNGTTFPTEIKSSTIKNKHIRSLLRHLRA